MTTASAGLERECEVFTRLLTGQTPTEYVIRKYVDGHRARPDLAAVAGFERVLLGHAARGPVMARLADAYARIIDHEAWIIGLHISPYSHASPMFSHQTDRQRKLLLHRAEIDRLRARVDQERLTLVPLTLYFKDGRAKLEVGLGRGRTSVDKRQVIAKRDADLEAKRAMSRARAAQRSGR